MYFSNWWKVEDSNLGSPQGADGLQPPAIAAMRTFHKTWSTIEDSDLGDEGTSFAYYRYMNRAKNWSRSRDSNSDNFLTKKVGYLYITTAQNYFLKYIRAQCTNKSAAAGIATHHGNKATTTREKVGTFGSCVIHAMASNPRKRVMKVNHPMTNHGLHFIKHQNLEHRLRFERRFPLYESGVVASGPSVLK